MSTPFDTVNGGFDNGSSAFLLEEVGEIFFVVHEKVFDEGGRAEGVVILRGCVLFTILLYIIEKEHLYFNVNSSKWVR